MRKKFDINQWNRKEHFEFFLGMDDPYWGLSSKVDCTKIYQSAKENQVSFFIAYLYCSIKAVNEIFEFRLRIDDDQLYHYDHIHAGATIQREDQTFGFSQIKYDESFKLFAQNAIEEIQRVKMNKELFSSRDDINVIHYSSLPWVNFSSITHARKFGHQNGIPKITFGKIKKTGELIELPISIHVHHALLDGFHVGQYIEHFQNLLNTDLPL